MLQKPEKVGYNRVSRRQILRVLGIGVVIASVAAGGCAYSQRYNPIADSVPMKEASANRLSSVGDVKGKWKEVFLNLKDGSDGKIFIHRGKFEAAVASFKTLVSDYVNGKLRPRIDKALTIVNLSEQREELNKISKELQTIAMPQEYIAAMQNAWTYGNREAARQHVLKIGGTGPCWQTIEQQLQRLASVSTNAQSLVHKGLNSGINSDQIELAKCNISGPITCAVAFAVAAYICSQDAGACEGALETAAIVCVLAIAWNGCLPR